MKSLKSLFNISIQYPVHQSMKDGDTAEREVLTGVINTGQSAMTFGGAPVIVTVIWKVLGAAIPALAGSKLCALAISILISLVIYALSESASGTAKEKARGYVYAVINAFAIAATVLGIDATLAGVSFYPAG